LDGFLIILGFAAMGQIFGSLIAFFTVEKFYKYHRKLVIAEISIMFAVSLMLIYEAANITPLFIYGLLLGIIILWLFNLLIPHKHLTKSERICTLVFAGMSFHLFPEGIAVGSAFLIDPTIGITTAVFIALHNIPEGMLLTTPYFLDKKITKGFHTVIITAGLFIIGGLGSYYFLGGVSETVQAILMAFAAGAMIYLAAEEYLICR
jgi:zinc transporter, ZIP family